MNYWYWNESIWVAICMIANGIFLNYKATALGGITETVAIESIRRNNWFAHRPFPCLWSEKCYRLQILIVFVPITAYYINHLLNEGVTRYSISHVDNRIYSGIEIRRCLFFIHCFYTLCHGSFWNISSQFPL